MKINLRGALLRALTVAGMLAPAISAYAVSPKEMEQARAIAATMYLRYANNHSDYLDKVRVSSLDELASKVSDNKTDTENLRKFRAKGMRPQEEYQNWDKEQLIEYWGGQFFTNANLQTDGAQLRNNVIKSRIKQMNVTSPAAEQPAPEQTEQPQLVEEPQPVQQTYPQEVPMPTVPAVAPTDSVSPEEAQIEAEKEKSGNNTWIYVIILIVLIIIVIALVVFALRQMRTPQQAGGSSSNGGGGGNGNVAQQNVPDMMLEPSTPQQQPLYKRPEQRRESPAQPQVSAYAPQPRDTQSDAEIADLRRRLDDALRSEADARTRADQLATQLSALQLENDRLRAQAAERQRATVADQFAPRYAAEAPAKPTLNDNYSREDYTAVQPRRAPGAPTAAPRQQRGAAPNLGAAADQPIHRDGERIIYLGRANRQKIFVRADKKFTIGKTIYRLVTTNGLTGTFVVDPNPAVAEWASLDPESAFCAASELPSMANADSFTRIVTDTPGTAIFEDGCWKVLRPAAVHLE